MLHRITSSLLSHSTSPSSSEEDESPAPAALSLGSLATASIKINLWCIKQLIEWLAVFGHFTLKSAEDKKNKLHNLLTIHYAHLGRRKFHINHIIKVWSRIVVVVTRRHTVALPCGCLCTLRFDCTFTHDKISILDFLSLMAYLETPSTDCQREGEAKRRPNGPLANNCS